MKSKTWLWWRNVFNEKNPRGWKEQAKPLPIKDLLKLIVLACLPLLFFLILRVSGRANALKMIQQLESNTFGPAGPARTDCRVNSVNGKSSGIKRASERAGLTFH